MRWIWTPRSHRHLRPATGRHLTELICRTTQPIDERHRRINDKVEVRTRNAPAPAAAYSEGVRKGSILQVSGQVAPDPTINELVHVGDVAAQTTQVLINIKTIVDASGVTSTTS